MVVLIRLASGPLVPRVTSVPYARPYNRTYNFQTFQRDNPSRPTPADRLDAEFNEVKIALDQTQANLKKIQRSDGYLGNGVVTRDSLSPSLSIGFTFRGQWATDVNYIQGDGVSLGSKFFIAQANHLSATQNGPDQNTLLWKVQADFTQATTDAQAAAAAAAESANEARAASSAAATSVLDLAARYLNFPVVRLGYIGDGAPHPLSSVTVCQGRNTAGWSLAQWRTLFPSAHALSDEIDGLAIQTYVDTNPAGVQLLLPPGKGRCSRSPVSSGAMSVQVSGCGRDVTTLLSITAGQDGWQHGLTTPARAPICFENIRLECGGQGVPGNVFAGGTAINVVFDQSTPSLAWCHRLYDVLIQGAGDQRYNYWARATFVKNPPRGVSWQDVVTYAQALVITPGNAHDFEATTGCYSHQFVNTMSVGYEFAFGYTFTGKASGNSQEGATFYNCQGYSGRGLFRAVNNLGESYFPPQWYFTDTGWQGIGPAFVCGNLQNVKIRGGLLVTDPSTAPNRVLASFTNCVDVMVEGLAVYTPAVNGVGSGPTSNLTPFYVAGPLTENIKFRHLEIANFQTWDQIFFFANDLTPNQVSEKETYVHPVGAFTFGKCVDASGRQISGLNLEALEAAGFTATVDDKGRHTISGRVEGVTDSKGRIPIVFPTRPNSGATCFPGGVPKFTYSVFSGADFAGAGTIPGTHGAVSKTQGGAVVQFQPNGGGLAGQLWQIDWTASGS